MSGNNSTGSKYISIREAARILNVHTETLRRWDNSGRLKAQRVGPRNDRKYLPFDIIKALEMK